MLGWGIQGDLYEMGKKESSLPKRKGNQPIPLYLATCY